MYKLLKKWEGREKVVQVNAGAVKLEGNLSIPNGAKGIVVFVHGSGSSRCSPRNQFVSNVLNTAGLGTLLFDLLTLQEEEIDDRTGQLRFNISFLSERVIEATKWLGRNDESVNLKIGYFGASTGAAAALVAASQLPNLIKAVVSRGGRPDLANSALPHVLAPTLLIVGENDPVVIDLNQQAFECLPATTKKIYRNCAECDTPV